MPRSSPRGLHAPGSANRLRITNRAHNPARDGTSPGGRLPFLVAFRAGGILSSSFQKTPVPRERVDSSVRLHWFRFYTSPDAARSREGLPAPCHTHHRVASTPAAAEGIGATARWYLVWDVSLRAAPGGAAAAVPPRAPLGARRSVPK